MHFPSNSTLYHHNVGGECLLVHSIMQLCISKYYQNYADVPDAGDVRLTGRYRGRVDVLFSTQWVAVANSTSPWTLDNAQVVCRELGYDLNGNPPTMTNSFWIIMLFFNRHNIA